MAFQGFDSGMSGLVGAFRATDEFAIAALADASFPGAIPKIPARRRRDGKISFAGIGKFAGLIVTVSERPHLFDEIRRVRGHAPFVPIRAHFAIDVKVVEQDELASDLMEVGRGLLGKKAKLGITIAFRHIAEHLIIGAILFDDIKAVFNWTGSSQRKGN